MGNKSGALSQKEVEQITSETKWNKKTLEELQKDFNKHDSDKSGSLNVSEFKELMKSRLNMTNEGLENLFKLMDTDNGGNISFKELVIALNQLGNGDAKEKLAYVFDMYDTDGNGKLDHKEIEHIVEQMTKVAESTGGALSHNTKEFNQSLMQKLDPNNDGSIDRNEWIEKGSSSPSLMALLGIRKI